MVEISTIAQTVAIVSACWAIISGVGAWKREFIGKRKIELAEQVLAQFFEVRDAIAYIRNPFSSSDEGKTRNRSDSETEEESKILDRGYIAVERYASRANCFAQFNTMKYRFMASFGKDTEKLFADTNRALNSIFVSARELANHYWQRQGRAEMSGENYQTHLDEMHRHEKIFWDMNDDEDVIHVQLQSILSRLEAVTAPSFQEPMTLFRWLTAKWGKG